MNKISILVVSGLAVLLTGCLDEVSCSSSAVQNKALKLFGTATMGMFKASKMQNIRTIAKNELGNVACIADTTTDFAFNSEISESQGKIPQMTIPIEYFVSRTDDGGVYVQVP